jgi:hypothetical protein
LHRYLYANSNPLYYTDLDGYESVSTMIDHGAEGCGAFSCAGWALLKGAYVVGTLGFASVHDPVRDAYDEGKISDKQYAVGVAGGAAVTAVNITATVFTAGTGTAATAAVGTTLVSRLIGATVTGAAIGLANDSVTQATHVGAGIQEEYSVKQAAVSTAAGAAFGLGGAALVEGAVAGRNYIAGMRKPTIEAPQAETSVNNAANEAANQTKSSLTTENQGGGAPHDSAMEQIKADVKHSNATGPLRFDDPSIPVVNEASGLDTQSAPHGQKVNDPIPGQSHHLLQDKAYNKVIPRDEGIAVKLEGNIMTDVGSPHFKAHVTLEQFWNQFRRGGERAGQIPTNLEYTQALGQSLRAAGYTEAEAKQLINAVIEQRIQYGLLGGQKVPNVPGAIGGKVRAAAKSGE